MVSATSSNRPPIESTTDAINQIKGMETPKPGDRGSVAFDMTRVIAKLQEVKTKEASRTAQPVVLPRSLHRAYDAAASRSSEMMDKLEEKYPCSGEREKCRQADLGLICAHPVRDDVSRQHSELLKFNTQAQKSSKISNEFADIVTRGGIIED
jgi:hypothetical protein